MSNTPLDITDEVQIAVLSKLLSRLTIKDDFKCLDIGCLTGTSTLLLADKLGKDGQVTGVDPDLAKIQVAKASSQSQGKKVEYLVAKGSDLSASECAYDLIVSSTMHWVNKDEKLQTYRNMFKALKTGGVLACVELAGFSGEMAEILACLQPKDLYSVKGIFHLVSADWNKEIFQELGFEIIHVEREVVQYKFPSLDMWCIYFTHALRRAVDVDVKQIYDVNVDKVNIRASCDGSFTTSGEVNFIIVKKK